MSNSENEKLRGMKSFKLTLVGFVLLILLIASIGMCAMGTYFLNKSMSDSNKTYEAAVNSGYRTEIKSQVQSVIAILQNYYNLAANGTLSETEAKDAAKEIIRGIRYRDDDSGYMWIDDTDYKLVMHPILPEQEGDNRYELEDKNGVMIIQNIMKSAEEGGGYNEFYFTKSDGVTVAPKVAYSEMFEPWGWIVTTGNYVDDMMIEITAKEDKINKEFTYMIMGFVCICVLIIVAGVVVAWLFGHHVVKDIREIDNNLHLTAKGDLAYTVESKILQRADEIGNMARSLNKVKASLADMISEVIDSSEKLKTSSTEFEHKFSEITGNIRNIDKVIDDLANGATEQASETEVVSSKIKELGKVIDLEKTDADSLGQSVSSMMKYSDTATKSINALYDITEKTTDAIDVVYEQTVKNNEAVSNINGAVAIIKEMAEQTNLLSLNASIEAARAGEAGKGFAVVAEEIMKLAEQSSDSAADIENIVEDLIQNVGSSVKKMDEVNKEVDIQKSKLAETRQAFNHLYSEIQEVSTAAKEIDEQAGVLERLKCVVDEATTGLASIVEENAASMQETNASMQLLAETVGDCLNDTQTLVDLSNRQSEDTKHFKL